MSGEAKYLGESEPIDLLAALQRSLGAECGARIATVHPQVSQSCVLPVLHAGDHSPVLPPSKTRDADHDPREEANKGARAGERVHNHPPYRPVCNERRVDGQLRGACLNDDGTDRPEPTATSEES